MSPVEFPFEEALRNAMQIEKHAMDYYRVCARHMRNPNAVKLFQLLAREEEEHAASFYRAYPHPAEFDFAAFIAREPPEAEGWLADLGRKLAEIDERHAMEVAMEKELRLEEHLRAMAHTVTEPAVRAVYEENARSTRQHYELIEAEYARLMGMVHDSDIDIYVRE